MVYHATLQAKRDLSRYPASKERSITLPYKQREIYQSAACISKHMLIDTCCLLLADAHFTAGRCISAGGSRLRSACGSSRRCSKSLIQTGIGNDEFCIKNDGIFIQHDELCIKNDELCIQNDGFCIQMMNRDGVVDTRELWEGCHNFGCENYDF